MKEFIQKLLDNTKVKKPRNLKEFLVLAIKIGIYLTLLMPVVISPLTTFPVLIPKVLYFRFLIEIIFFLYVLLVLIDRKYLPRLSPIFIAILIFIEVLVLTTWRGINPERSFWGTMERMEGLILFLHLFVFFVISVGVLKERRQWINILRATVLVSFFVGCAALLQKFKIIFFYTNPQDYRLSATLGNPVFYGNYLSFLIFLAIFLGIFEQKKLVKFFFWFLAVFNSFLLFFTGTRGAWLGAVFAFGFLFICWMFFTGKRTERERLIFLFSVFVILLFFLIFLLFSELGYLSVSNLFNRYQSLWYDLVSLKNARFAVWGLGISGWKDSLLLGYGLDSFSYIFDKYYRASLLETVPETLFFDRPHNQIIEVLVATGILGLLSYLTLFAVAIFLILRNSRKYFNSLLGLVLVSLFLALFVQNFFSFDTIITYFLLFLILAFIDVSFNEEKNIIHFGEEEKKEQKSVFGKKNVLVGKVILALLAFFLTVEAILINIKFCAANTKLAQAHELMGSNHYQEAFEVLREAARGPNFTKFETYYYSIETIFFAEPLSAYEGVQKEFTKELLTKLGPLEDILDKKSEIFQMRGYMTLMRLYKNMYEIERNPEYLKDEERVIGKAIAFNPEYPGSYRMAGNLRFLQNRREEGIVFFSKAMELDNDISKFYYWIGMSLVEVNDKEKSADNLRLSMKLGDFYRSEITLEKLKRIWSIAELYEATKSYKNMADFYEEVISHYPGGQAHPQIFASLSTVYAKMGDKKRARETTYRMLELYPGLKSQAEQFLNNLENL